MPSSNAPSEKGKIISGVAWLLALNWTNRLLGFLSIVILARLLTPADFGVMAILLLAIQFTETLTNVGSEQYYIQKENESLDDLNCAWSTNLLMKSLATVVFAIITPWLASIFDYKHLIPAFLAISLIPLISALSNGYILRQKKDLNFKDYVSIKSSVTFIGNVSSIVLALIFQNYWALLAGLFINHVLFMIGSYIFIKSRATFSLIGWRTQYQFSKWVILKSVLGHVRAKFDIWFVASHFGVTSLGGYNLSKDIVLLPSRELMAPMSEVFFTSIAKLKNGSNEQKLRIRKSLTILYCLSFPIAFGWGGISLPFVSVVLGEQWLPYASVISILGFIVIGFTIGDFVGHIMTSTGNVKALFIYDAATLILALASLALIFPTIHSLEDVAYYRVLLGVVIVIIGLVWLSKLKIVSIVEVLKPAILPGLLSLLMLIMLQILGFSNSTSLLALVMAIGVSAILYIGLLIIGCKLKGLGAVESAFVMSLVTDTIQKAKLVFRSQ